MRPGGNSIKRRMPAFDPTALNGRDQSWMRIERPVATDFALQAMLLPKGWQDEFDGGGVKANPSHAGKGWSLRLQTSRLLADAG